MPIYEYECECGYRFEDLGRISQSSEDNVCPKCRRVAKRIISLTGKAKIATPFTVIGHDGNVLSRTQTTDKTPPTGYRHDNPNVVEV